MTNSASTMPDYIHHFFVYGVQYYAAGRYAAFAGLTPIAGNVLHHSVEMFVKGGLSRTATMAELKRLGHHLPSLWHKFKAASADRALDSYDPIITTLNEFEEIRYPDALAISGGLLQIDITKHMTGQNVSRTESAIPEYRLCLQEIDELIAAIFRGASRNPAAYLQLSKMEAAEYVFRDNRAFASVCIRN